MRFLIVEDELASMRLLAMLLGPLGSCDTVIDGDDGVQAVRRALAAGKPYDVICLDINLGRMDGHEALRKIREAEKAAGLAYGRGARIVMTTAQSDATNVMSAFHRMCDAYLVKPVTRPRLFAMLRELGIDAARSEAS